MNQHEAEQTLRAAQRSLSVHGQLSQQLKMLSQNDLSINAFAVRVMIILARNESSLVSAQMHVNRLERVELWRLYMSASDLAGAPE